jgi:hypothetical protein
MDSARALRAERLTAPLCAFSVIAVLAAIPLLLWHRVLADVLASFQWKPVYLLGELGPWLLLAIGLGFLIPVAVSAGLDPESRLYPRGRGRYFIWGVILYLLGIAVVVQMYDLWNYAH